MASADGVDDTWLSLFPSLQKAAAAPAPVVAASVDSFAPWGDPGRRTDSWTAGNATVTLSAPDEYNGLGAAGSIVKSTNALDQWGPIGGAGTVADIGFAGDPFDWGSTLVNGFNGGENGPPPAPAGYSPTFSKFLADNGITSHIQRGESGGEQQFFKGSTPIGAEHKWGEGSDDAFGIGVLLAGAFAGASVIAAGAGAGAGGGAVVADSSVAAGGWTTPSYSLGGAGGSGLTATTGQGLTLAATTGTGSGLAAAAGDGLTLAAATGTGAGLAVGTGTSIIGSGIGAGLADLGLSASQVAAWSAPAAGSSLGTATAADSIAKAAAPAVTSSSGSTLGSTLGSAAGVAGGIAKVVAPIAGLIDQLTGGAQPGQPGYIAPGSAAASSRGLLLLVGAAGLVAYLATRK